MFMRLLMMWCKSLNISFLLDSTYTTLYMSTQNAKILLTWRTEFGYNNMLSAETPRRWLPSSGPNIYWAEHVRIKLSLSMQTHKYLHVCVTRSILKDRNDSEFLKPFPPSSYRLSYLQLQKAISDSVIDMTNTCQMSTHCDLVTPHGDIGFCQHWLR